MTLKRKSQTKLIKTITDLLLKLTPWWFLIREINVYGASPI